jgi:hypothetical protein
VKLRISILVLVVVTALLAGQSARSQNAFMSDQIKFGPVPPFLPAGAQIAVLEGDPMASTGDFTIRLKTVTGSLLTPIPTGRT